MTKKEEELVFITLSEMLPYGVKVQFEDEIYDVEYICPMYNEIKLDILGNYTIGISDIKPFLRPMSSMTEEERNEHFGRTMTIDIVQTSKEVIDWLNANHFDYRGLIERGLALEALDGMYNIKNK